MSNLARKILENTFSQVFGRIITAILAVIIIKMLTGYLGESGYGKYGSIFEFLAFFGVLADFGIFTISIREMSKNQKMEKKIFENAFFLRIIFGVLAMILAAIIGFLITKFRLAKMSIGISIAAASTFFVILTGTISTILQIRLKMQIVAIANIIGKFFSLLLIITIIFVAFKQPSEASFNLIIFSGTIGAIISFLITAFFVRKIFPLKPKFSKKVSKKILRESLPFAIALALHTAYFRVDILLLNFLLPISNAGNCWQNFCADIEAGKYLVAARVLEIFLLIPIFFGNSILPEMSRRIEKKNINTTKSFFENCINFILAISFSISIFVFFFAPQIIEIISNNNFLANEKSFGSDTALKIFAIFTPAAFFSMLLGFFLIAVGEQKKLILTNFLATFLNIIGNFWAITRIGFFGAALVSLFCEFFLLIIIFYFAVKNPFFSLERNKIIKILLVNLFAGIFLFLFKKTLNFNNIFLEVFLSGVFFVGFLFFIFWKLQIINTKMLKFKN